MSIAERYREYARVLDMCEGTSVYPWSCVKYMGKPWIWIDKATTTLQSQYWKGNPCLLGIQFTMIN